MWSSDSGRSMCETHSVIRFATSWATTMEDTQKLIQILEKNK